MFKADYVLFVTSRNADDIPSVQVFKEKLAEKLSKDIDKKKLNSEEKRLACACEAVVDWRCGRVRLRLTKEKQILTAVYFWKYYLNVWEWQRVPF